MGIFACLFVFLFFCPSIICTAGEYLKSAHGKSAQRPVLAGKYAIGNCGHCHEQHASIKEAEAPNGPFVYLEAENEEDLCYACHDSAEANGAPDIKTDITTANNHGHLVQSYSGIHRNNETLDITKHIECTDCHNPHKANDTLHTPGSETEATVLTTSSPLYGVTGATPDYFSTLNKYGIWQAPAIEDYTLKQTATKEYEICFKCHSLANADLTSWGGAFAEAWTDVGQEFSPYNRSGHPVVTGLNNYPNSIAVDRGTGPYKGLYNTTDGLIWDQILDPWSNAGQQTMYCSDCHASNSPVAGPHGSNAKWMLAGVNKAWPYTTFARNGSNDTEVVPDPYNFTTSPGTFEIFRRLENTEALPLGDLGTDNGLFCSNCHHVSQWTLQANNVHSPGQHARARCIDCHIRVPHGGKVSRLIAAVNDTTYTGHLPPRYTGSGTGYNGSGGTIPAVKLYQKRANWSYNPGRCLSASTAFEIATEASKLCNYHGTGPGGLGETW